MFGIVLLAVVVAGIIVGVLANSRWAGERGWVYNRHNPRAPGVGLAPGTFDEIYQPSIRHMIEEQASERVRADQDESGDRTDRLPHPCVPGATSGDAMCGRYRKDTAETLPVGRVSPTHLALRVTPCR